MRILTGAASWTDPTLLACGRFYPPAVAANAEARLRYYAARFPLVEVDSSYYALPTAENAWRWDQRTPDGFVFNIKAFRLFTGHQTPLSALPADIRAELDGWPAPFLYYNDVPGELRDELWRRYTLALEPLRLPGKLGAVHFQFPPWIRRDARGHAALAEAARRMDEHLISIELRHRSWFDSPAATAGTLALLRDLGAVHTVVDAPAGPENSVPAVWASTHPELTLLRLHGRNAPPGTGPRKPRRDASSTNIPRPSWRNWPSAFPGSPRSAQAHAVFNTNFEDQGVRNAAAFAAALPGSETRSPMRSWRLRRGPRARLARHFRQAVQQHLELARDVLLGHAGKPSSSPGRRSAGSA